MRETCLERLWVSVRLGLSLSVRLSLDQSLIQAHPAKRATAYLGNPKMLTFAVVISVGHRSSVSPVAAATR